MSVEVTRLDSGLSVVTDAMPHLKTASLGVWVASGSRHERPERITKLPVDRAAVERHIITASRAAREGAAA